MNKQLIHVLSGNTQLLRDPRHMSREVDPACDAVWSLEDFDTLLRRYLFEEYPSIPHAGLGGMTPAERFKQGAETLAVGHPLPDSPDLRFLLWPYAKRRTAMVHRQRGIVVDGVHYWNAAMSEPPLHRRKVEVRVDPCDAGHVVAYLQGVWRLCTALSYYDVFHGRSRRELRLAAAILRKRHRGEPGNSHVREKRLANLLRDIRGHEELARQRMPPQATELGSRTGPGAGRRTPRSRIRARTARCGSSRRAFRARMVPPTRQSPRRACVTFRRGSRFDRGGGLDPGTATGSGGLGAASLPRDRARAQLTRACVYRDPSALADGMPPSIVALVGSTGVGKTTLAERVIRDVREGVIGPLTPAILRSSVRFVRLRAVTASNSTCRTGTCLRSLPALRPRALTGTRTPRRRGFIRGSSPGCVPRSGPHVAVRSSTCAPVACVWSYWTTRITWRTRLGGARLPVSST